MGRCEPVRWQVRRSVREIPRSYIGFVPNQKPVIDQVTQGDYRTSTVPCTGFGGKTGTVWADLSTEAVSLEPDGRYLLALESTVLCQNPAATDFVPCPPDPPGQSVGSYGAVVAQVNW